MSTLNLSGSTGAHISQTVVSREVYIISFRVSFHDVHNHSKDSGGQRKAVGC